jgi:hypothetical protein
LDADHPRNLEIFARCLTATIEYIAKCESEAEVIASVLACIAEGINTKMKLSEATAKHAGVSKRQALAVIERYSGEDPAVHKWSFSIAGRGAKVFTLLENCTPPASTAT